MDWDELMEAWADARKALEAELKAHKKLLREAEQRKRGR